MVVPRFLDTVASHEAAEKKSQPEKRPYSTPKLTIFGSMAEYLEKRGAGVQPGREVLPARH